MDTYTRVRDALHAVDRLLEPEGEERATLMGRLEDALHTAIPREALMEPLDTLPRDERGSLLPGRDLACYYALRDAAGLLDAAVTITRALDELIRQIVDCLASAAILWKEGDE